MKAAIIVALLYWLIQIANDSGASSFGFFRPIFAAPVVGLFLGDFKTGLIMGAELEAIYMGIVGFGGSTPSDATSAAVICTAYVILGGMTTEAAIAFAIPIGTLMVRADQLVIPLHSYFVPKFDKYAAAGDTKRFLRLHKWYRVLISKTPHALIIFFAVWVGAENVQRVINLLPGFIMSGLTIAGNLLPCVGLGILCSMTFTRQQGAWLFIGFVLYAYLGLGNMAIAILGGAAAVLTFFKDMKLADMTRSLAAVPAGSAQNSEEEDFLNE